MEVESLDNYWVFKVKSCPEITLLYENNNSCGILVCFGLLGALASALARKRPILGPLTMIPSTILSEMRSLKKGIS